MSPAEMSPPWNVISFIFSRTDNDSESSPLRQKQAAQLRSIIYQLHEARIVWEDAKSENVLIDMKQDAWIVDFGGGYTEGWVPEKLAGTMDGNQHALGKMVEFIGI
jgi:Ser/Thr protein kinase RdoA (MazF antagonist)